MFFFLSFSFVSSSQVIHPSGTTDRPASQLIFWYDNDQITNDRGTLIQVTNQSDSSPIWIHVQIFRSLDVDGDISTTTDKIICDERDFVDFLTPQDTHVYSLAEPDFHKNMGESGSSGTGSGEETSVDVLNSKGFVVITPIVDESDLTAISFPYLYGTSLVTEPDRAYRLNAVGRQAVNYTDGSLVPDGTPLDGTTNGFLLIQPEELYFSYSNLNGNMDIVGISLQDVYGPAGLLGYRAVPADAQWTRFVFDSVENAFSCGNENLNCFASIGLNDTNGDANTLIDDRLFCPGNDTLLTASGLRVGTGLIFVSGLEDNENLVGLTTFRETIAVTGGGALQIGGADWMLSEGEEEIVGASEAGPVKCSDGIDNDSDGLSDCEDPSCDGFSGCEFGSELSCGDDVDNDADGLADCDDDDSAGTFFCGVIVSDCDNYEPGNGGETIVGTNGPDRLRGTDGDDVIIGLNGDDIILGSKGNDCIDAGLGVDKVNGQNGNDDCYDAEEVINCEGP